MKRLEETIRFGRPVDPVGRVMQSGLEVSHCLFIVRVAVNPPVINTIPGKGVTGEVDAAERVEPEPFSRALFGNCP